MKIVKDILKLVGILIILAIVFYFIQEKSKSVDREKRYQHPITRPGGGW